MATPPIEVQRVYDNRWGRQAEYRVLVDRLWPRGMAKSDLRFDRWAKELAPSTELRRWYGHDPDRFDEFSARYLAELRQPEAAQAVVGLLAGAGPSKLVLLTATRDVERSGAAVLADHLRRRRR